MNLEGRQWLLRVEQRLAEAYVSTLAEIDELEGPPYAFALRLQLTADLAAYLAAWHLVHELRAGRGISGFHKFPITNESRRTA